MNSMHLCLEYEEMDGNTLLAYAQTIGLRVAFLMMCGKQLWPQGDIADK